jgi:hypothetical protein
LPAGATLNLTGPFSNFTGTTLAGGAYLIGGTFQFAGANIVTNAAFLDLDGAGQILDGSGNDGLAHFAINDAAGTFIVSNGRNFTAGDFSNNGTLTIGAGSIFTVSGNLTNFAGTTLTGGTYVIGGTFAFTGAN